MPPVVFRNGAFAVLNLRLYWGKIRHRQESSSPRQRRSGAPATAVPHVPLVREKENANFTKEISASASQQKVFPFSVAN